MWQFGYSTDEGTSKCGRKKYILFQAEKKWTKKDKKRVVKPPLVNQNYDYLLSSLSACKTKDMVDQTWKWIADSIDCINDYSFDFNRKN